MVTINKLGMLLVLGIMLLTGCARQVPPLNSPNELVWKFEQRLRWQDYQEASRFFDPELRSGFLDSFAVGDDLHIVDVRRASMQPAEEGDGLQVCTVMEYYLLPSASVREFRFCQKWQHRRGPGSQAGGWFIVTPFTGFPPP